MTQLCLTSKRGTPLLGVYRGLKLKTRDTQWEVEVVRSSVDQLRQGNSFPVVVPVRLESPPVMGAGWLRGQDHAVVLFGFTRDDRAVVGDPTLRYRGRTLWTVEELRQRRRGEALRLVTRKPKTIR